MKSKKQIVLSSLLMAALFIVFCMPALAVVSDYDSQYLSPQQQSDIATYTQAWISANESGNAAAAAAAHEAAEAVRATQNYSGGADGSQYIPIGSSGSGYTGGGYYYPPAPTIYTVTASAGSGGGISPSGSTSITSGNSQTYTITANSGYRIQDVKVDGSSIGAASTYTFSSVSASHSISVTFASSASLSAGNTTLGDGGSGTLESGNKTKSGYGVTASLPVDSSYVSGTTVTASYNFTSPQTISLEYVNGTWQFPVNTSSPTGARKIYIPINTPGTASNPKSYTITFTVRALDPQATVLTGSNVYLTSTKTVTLTINGSMYDEDFTGVS